MSFSCNNSLLAVADENNPAMQLMPSIIIDERTKTKPMQIKGCDQAEFDGTWPDLAQIEIAIEGKYVSLSVSGHPSEDSSA